MPDAFHPRKLAALAGVAAVAGVAIGYGLSSSTTSDRSATPTATTATVARKLAPCRLDLAALSAAGCRPLKSDPGTVADPAPLWGKLDCATGSRQQLVRSGSSSFRRLTVIDGDNVFGERCELGLNDYRGKTFTLYREGEHRVTFFSIRLPASFPLAVDDWQLVMQMKQTQPSDNGNGTPVLALEARQGQWKLFHSASVDQSGIAVELWSAPARTETWTRFAFDVVYSKDPTVGRIKVYADLNGDGDALDAGEQSPTLTTYTLKRETAAETEPDDDPLPQGESIPSHLRLGIYHHDPIACPAPAGCAVDVDNVQVYAAP
jgi:hypothetical protein